MPIPFIEENDQTGARHDHLEALRLLVGNIYPNRFGRSQVVEPGREDTISAIVEKFRLFEPRVAEGGRPRIEEIEQANRELNKITVRLAGRIASPPRVMGRAAFVHLSDGKQRLQIYLRKADVVGVSNGPERGEVDGWELFGLLDHGDFIGIEGYLFITKSGELSVHVQRLQFLAKALLPMPDKMHGINDPEIRQRQRYADLIAGSLKIKLEEDQERGSRQEDLSAREVFERRSQIIRELRRILDDHGYLEVETPMLSPLATGAMARPFKTRHNALNINLYARIAPELYLKRLVVGGLERVYELNRNFRNEGISTRHNPEFTMLEFYCAYMDVNGMMDFCEEMLRAVVFKVLGHTHVRFGEHDIDFSRRFQRLTMKEAILRYRPAEWKTLGQEAFHDAWLDDPRRVLQLYLLLHGQIIDGAFDKAAESILGLDTQDKTDARRLETAWRRAEDTASRPDVMSHEMTDTRHAQHIEFIFGRVAEPRLAQPTFITDFPKLISPLSKSPPTNPAIAERFELFIAGMECANGFSELNDPEEQYQRFKEQTQQRERGDEEAMVLDEDYIRALSYGMPPAAGIGIGIDRLVMLLTNRQSIRDVILFPHMRPERKVDGLAKADSDEE